MEMLDEIVSEFLVESYESLDQLDRDLMALEEAPEDRDRLGSIFRTIHTIKGTSGFLAFPKLERLTHVGESLLVPLRDGELKLTNDIANNLLAMVDAVRSMLASIEVGNGEGDDEYESLIDALEHLKSAEQTDLVKPASASPAEQESGGGSDASDASQEADPGTPAAKSSPKPAPAEKSTTSAGVSEASEEKSSKQSGSSLADSTVRIDVHLLDELMNLVGELVLARNQILQFNEIADDPTMSVASQRLNLITTELQEGVMKTRMQPIRNAWSKLPRVVRDLSQSCGKQVQVKMEGADTELDKTILEAIKDPLTHIVRNSVDHGIEAPSARIAAGKPVEGTLLLRAYHEGGQVNIEIADDGGGISVDRVRDKAVKNGIITEDQAVNLSDRDAVQLILLPGFSTAPKVTNVSGRGVGMDVVKTNVEKIGGTLDIQSKPGEGTTLRIKIPLTLAIVPALVVSCQSERYCIPQVSLLELVRLEAEQAGKEIEILHSVPVYRLRGRILPLVYLDEELGLRPRRTSPELTDSDAVNIVVLQAEDHQFGLVVGQINDTQEIVVKPLGRHLKNTAMYAGATIMGDGTVSLILDVLGIAKQSHVFSEHARRPFLESELVQDEDSSVQDSYLVVDPGDNSRAAIRLSTVARLEEFSPDEIEFSGNRQVIQYRGDIMPLVSLSHGAPPADGERVSLVVYNTGDTNVGVVVGKVIDIVSQAGVTVGKEGAAIVAGRVTKVLDLSEVAACA